jgi:very-short-patch-repair endonuclease
VSTESHLGGDKLDQPLAALAGRQHGLVTAGQLVALGLSRNGIRERVRRGALHRHHRGVYSVGHAALAREGEMFAAVLAAREGAALGHDSVAELFELMRGRSPELHVVVPKRRTVPGVRVHRTTLHPLDVIVYRGIPMTNVARTLVDLSETWTADELTYAIGEAAFHKRFNLEATRRAMDRANGRHRLHVLEEAIAEYLDGSKGAKSRKESAFLELLKAAGIVKPRVNVVIEGEEVDAHWPDRRLIVEVDGAGHRRPNVKRNDARRDRLLAAAGWRVLRIDAEKIEAEPAEVLVRLARFGLGSERMAQPAGVLVSSKTHQ